MKLYVIEEGQLNALARLAQRLFTEDRMNGDEMRDGAQTLDRIVAVWQRPPPANRANAPRHPSP